jgi:hypothetical protein
VGETGTKEKGSNLSRHYLNIPALKVQSAAKNKLGLFAQPVGSRWDMRVVGILVYSQIDSG